jgi:hypothetical protein
MVPTIATSKMTTRNHEVQNIIEKHGKKEKRKNLEDSTFLHSMATSINIAIGQNNVDKMRSFNILLTMN